MTMRYGRSLYRSNTTYTVYMYKSRDEWLKGRVRGIGGSDAAAAIGRNPWKSNLQLWEEKTGRKKIEDISDKPSVKYGTDAEEYLRRLYQLDRAGKYEVQYMKNVIIQSVRYPELLYSPDGLLLDKKNGKKGLLEIKTTSIMRSYDREKWNDRIPDNYFIQVLHGLNVTGFDFIELCAQLKYDDNYSQRRIYHIDRSDVEDDCEYLKEQLCTFWREYVLPDIEPGLILPQI